MAPARAGRIWPTEPHRLGEPAEQAQTPGRSPQPPPASRAAAGEQTRHLEQNPNARLCALLCAEGSQSTISTGLN